MNGMQERTGDVTSCVKCLSVYLISTDSPSFFLLYQDHTDVQQDCAILGLVHDVLIEDLIVQRLRSLDNTRHRE